MAEKIILTGDRPTGRLHVGHYVGSLKRRVELQNSGMFDKIFIMIADAQALTDNADNPAKVRDNIMEVALDYLSVGIDPAKSHIFIQSYVTELTELTFYYQNLVTVSRLQRNPTVKAEIQMRNFEASIPVGFFNYPISQAADITAFHATTVPVGEDQMPMLEQTKEIVHKFNAVYGETLTDPQILLPDNKACLRLPGTDGKAKMSKSLGNFWTIRDALKETNAAYGEGCGAEVLRFFLLRSQYRSPITFSSVLIEEAHKALVRLYTALKGRAADRAALDWNEPFAARFKAAMDDDFNTALAVSVLFELATEINRTGSPELVRQLLGLGRILNILGMDPEKFLQGGAEASDDASRIEGLIEERALAKKAKNFARADEIRKSLLAEGIELQDGAAGTTWRRI